MGTFQKIFLTLTIIGAINWGLIGTIDFNLVETLFGSGLITKIVYILVGISGLINIGIYFMDLDKVE